MPGSSAPRSMESLLRAAVMVYGHIQAQVLSVGAWKRDKKNLGWKKKSFVVFIEYLDIIMGIVSCFGIFFGLKV